MKKEKPPVPRRDSVVALAVVLTMFGDVSKSTLYRWIADGRFPKQVRIGPKRTSWFQSDLDAHIAHLRGKRDAHRERRVA